MHRALRLRRAALARLGFLAFGVAGTVPCVALAPPAHAETSAAPACSLTYERATATGRAAGQRLYVLIE
jgi:hypothetical protein